MSNVSWIMVISRRRINMIIGNKNTADIPRVLIFAHILPKNVWNEMGTFLIYFRARSKITFHILAKWRIATFSLIKLQKMRLCISLCIFPSFFKLSTRRKKTQVLAAIRGWIKSCYFRLQFLRLYGCGYVCIP